VTAWSPRSAPRSVRRSRPVSFCSLSRRVPQHAPNGTHPLDDRSVDPQEVAREAATQIAKKTGVAKRDIALTLGSGWGKAADLIGETVAEIPRHRNHGVLKTRGRGARRNNPFDSHRPLVLTRSSSERAPSFTKTTAFVASYIRFGRLPRLARKFVVLTNGAGGLKESWGPGTPVLISDHINLTASSPLEQRSLTSPICTHRDYAILLDAVPEPDLDEGVYVQFRGPHYETPAEVQLAGRMGGHIARNARLRSRPSLAREAGMDVIGFSLITNLALRASANRSATPK